MLISIKYQEKQHFLGSGKLRMLFFLLINVIVVGILIFYEQEKVEHEKSFITSGQCDQNLRFSLFPRYTFSRLEPLLIFSSLQMFVFLC